MAQNMWRLLLLASSCFSTALSCSCVDDSFNQPREDAITDNFKFSPNVYTAVVSSADCKCYPESSTTRLDCLSYSTSENNVVVESIGKRYECLLGDGFQLYSVSQCDELKTTLVSSATVDMIPDIPPITNVTGEEYCGVSGYSGQGCELSNQPCFYNVTVGTVYKGSFSAGDVVSTSGPDVLTSCGADGRVLTLGVEYVVGIGGACDPISEWSTLESYSESEVALLEDLQQQCAEDPSTCNGAVRSHFSNMYFIPLTVLVSAMVFLLQ